MMYMSKMVACIKTAGKVLREDKDTVSLPFGSEYSILLKNLNLSQRVVVNVFIDGQSVTGNGLVINSSSEVELERFIGDDLTKDNKFKFIKMTQGIESHRGNNPEDGLVRIEFKYETPPLSNYYLSNDGYAHNRDFELYGATRGGPGPQASSNGHYEAYSKGIPTGSSSPQSFGSRDLSSKGITGKGEVSTQQFSTVSVRALESETHQIIFRLIGQVESDSGVVEVANPVTVNTLKYCDLCGKTYGSKFKHCPDDGNFLVIKASAQAA